MGNIIKDNLEVCSTIQESFTKSFHCEVMNELLFGLTPDQQRIVCAEAVSVRTRLSIQVTVLCGIAIDAIFESPSKLYIKSAPITDAVPTDLDMINREATLSDNLRQRTLQVKTELFLSEPINFDFKSQQHHRYHKRIQRSGLKMMIDHLQMVPQSIVITTLETIYHVVKRLFKKG